MYHWGSAEHVNYRGPWLTTGGYTSKTHVFNAGSGSYSSFYANESVADVLVDVGSLHSSALSLG